MCHKKGHFSCNCSQHVWNQPRSQGREAIVDDRSEADKSLPPQDNLQAHAQHWLQSVAEEGEDMKDLVLQDLLLCPSRDTNQVQGFEVARWAVSHNVQAKMSIVLSLRSTKVSKGTVHLVHSDLAVETLIQSVRTLLCT